MRRLEFSTADDGTFFDMCLKALADHGTAVKITTNDGRFPSYRPVEVMIDGWDTRYKGFSVVSGRTWNDLSGEYDGSPVFIDTESIDKVEVI